MIKCLIIINFLCIYFLPAHAQDTVGKNENWDVEKDKKIVVEFIKDVKNNNFDQIGSKMSFPFTRRYPLPEIKSKEDFLKHYREIFDDSLTKRLVNSDPDKDWAEVGWRGIMFHNGELWLDYEDGRLMSVHLSKFEENELNELIKLEKKNLYVSIREFKQPVCILETSKHKIRIDDLGNENYRYASWPPKGKMSDKPEVVLEKGEYIPEGSGGNHSYKFKNAGYVYECSIVLIGEANSPPALLTIYKGDKVILSQKAKIKVN